MKNLKKVRLGVIGVGGMGAMHANTVLSGEIGRCELTAIAATSDASLDYFDDKILKFNDGMSLISSGAVDAVLIATPHYSHTPLGVAAFKAGLHVLMEKPISVHKADCERLIAAHDKKKQIFAAMFQCRTDPQYIKLKKLLDDGELGELVRVNWIVTNWFRTEAYYASGSWRATWEGEGGGVLLNQCTHQLDLMQWLFGMPVRVRGFCGIGKRHKIEVEDEVTAYLEYKNGATGVFVTSTGEAPGTNRLEIVGDMGKLIVEDRKLMFTKNEESMKKCCRTSKDRFGMPSVWNVEIPVPEGAASHAVVMQNFVDAILDGAPLIAAGREGLSSVEFGNAILYSSLVDKPVDMPLDGKAYERMMKKMIRESTFVKKTVKGRVRGDFKNSFI